MLASAAVGTTTSNAQWVIASYCGFGVPPYSSCADTTTGRYAQNGAFYWGAGTVGVCQRGAYQGSTISRTCANNLVWGNDEYGWYYNNNLHVTLVAGNNSPWHHTIEGRGYIPASARAAPSPGTRSPQTIPAAPGRELQNRIAVLAGSDAAGARLAQQTPWDAVSVLANESGHVCVKTDRFGQLACNSLENTLAGANQGVAICSSDLASGTIAIYGVVADGIVTVDLEGGAGGTQSVPVVNNTYALELPASAAVGISSIIAHGKNGPTRAPAAVPADLSCA